MPLDDLDPLPFDDKSKIDTRYDLRELSLIDEMCPPLDLNALIETSQSWLFCNTPGYQHFQLMQKIGHVENGMEVDRALAALRKTHSELVDRDDTSHEDILGLTFALGCELCRFEKFEAGERALFDLLADLREDCGDLQPLKGFVFTALGQSALNQGNLHTAAEYYDDAIEIIESQNVQDKEILLTAYANRAALYLHDASERSTPLSESEESKLLSHSLRVLDILGDDISEDTPEQRTLRVMTFLNAGTVYARNEFLIEAEHFFDSSLLAREESKDDVSSNSIALRAHIANIFCRMGHFELMEKYICPALDWANAMGKVGQMVIFGPEGPVFCHILIQLPAEAIFAAVFVAARRKDRKEIIERAREYDTLPGPNIREVLSSYLEHFETIDKTDAVNLTRSLLEIVQL